MEELEDGMILERNLLLKRSFNKIILFNIGNELNIPYFDSISNGWNIDDEDKASFEIASKIDEKDLEKIFKEHSQREWIVFRGRFYTIENGKFSSLGNEKNIELGIQKVKARFGSSSISVLKALMKCGYIANVKDLQRYVKTNEIRKILNYLEKMKVIITMYKAGKYQEWEILEESIPIVEYKLGIRRKHPRTFRHINSSQYSVAKKVSSKKVEKPDPLLEEKKKIDDMNKDLEKYLEDLLKYRLKQTINFGKKFNINLLANYLQESFGKVLYFDSLLSIIQQYGLSNIEIIHEHGKTGKRTGWSLALFGDPGTGKSFSTRDMILGNSSSNIGAHGLLSRNRYCGGMTPARFIRIGEAYAGKTFNFIVPEFNDFFRYKGMVEPLKIAMEQGKIKYETYNETIGPYKFTSFFSVNYNVSVQDKGYMATIQDPNFNAIEDRMLCRLHRLTKERFVEITKSQMKLALGVINLQEDAQKIRDHLTLVYAIETEHPLIKNLFPYKPVMITSSVFEDIGKARKAILKQIPQRVVKFSARLEDKTLRFACAASLMDYFSSNYNFIPVSNEALRYAIKFYIEEASVRSREAFEPEDVLKKLYNDA